MLLSVLHKTNIYALEILLKISEAYLFYLLGEHSMRKHILELFAGVMYYLDVTMGLKGPWQEQSPFRSNNRTVAGTAPT